MNCTNCGATVIQGPDGRWSCNCGASGGFVPDSTTDPNPYFTVGTCTGCGEEVQGLHGRWTCSCCGANSPYLDPPEGWATEITAEELAAKTIAYG